MNAPVHAGTINGMYVGRRESNGHVRIRISITPARHWRSSSTWWCRTCSSPRRPFTPTWCCRPRHLPRSPAPPHQHRSARADRYPRAAPARRRSGRTCGSSRRLPNAWAWTGTTRDPRKCSLSWQRRCPRSTTSPGSASCAKARSPIRLTLPMSPETTSFSLMGSQPQMARRRSYRPTSVRPTKCPTWSTRWSCRRAGCSNTGIPDR